MSSSFEPILVAIDLADRSYPIVIGEQLIAQASTWADLPSAAMALIVTNDTVATLFADALHAALTAHFKRIHTVVLPDGETHKD